jgi:hypothetical protein
MIQRQGQVQATRYFTTLIGLLRDRSLFLEEIRSGIKLKSKVTSLLICSSLFFCRLWWDYWLLPQHCSSFVFSG